MKMYYDIHYLQNNEDNKNELTYIIIKFEIFYIQLRINSVKLQLNFFLS